MVSRISFVICLTILTTLDSIKTSATSSSSQGFSRFGCRFKNDQYELATLESKPVWGDRPVPPYKLTFEQALDLGNDIVDLNKNIITSLNLNNWDTLLSFYADYKRSKQSLHKFYKNYRVNFFIGTPSAQNVEILNEIRTSLDEKYPGIKKSLFLAARLIEPSKEAVAKYSRVEYRGTPRKNFFNHYIAVIRISFEQRLGYIVINPGHNDVHPTTLMDDEVLTFVKPSFETTRTEYSIIKNNSNYILQTYLLPPSNSSTQYIIFVGLPYCSILETTEKFNLLAMYRNLLQRNSDGVSKFGIKTAFKPSFTRLPSGAVVTNCTFETMYTELQSEKLTNPSTIFKRSFQDFMTNYENFEDLEKHALDTINVHFGFGEGGVQKKLIGMAQILNDVKFMRDVVDIKESIEFGRNDRIGADFAAARRFFTGIMTGRKTRH